MKLHATLPGERIEPERLNKNVFDKIGNKWERIIFFSLFSTEQHRSSHFYCHNFVPSKQKERQKVNEMWNIFQNVQINDRPMVTFCLIDCGERRERERERDNEWEIKREKATQREVEGEGREREREKQRQRQKADQWQSESKRQTHRWSDRIILVLWGINNGVVLVPLLWVHLHPEVQLVIKLCVAEDEERCGCVQISALCRTPLGAGARGGDGSSTSLQLACWQWCPGPLDGCHMLGSVPNRWWTCFNLQIFAIQLNSIDIYIYIYIYNNNSFISILMIRSYVTNKWVFHALWEKKIAHSLISVGKRCSECGLIVAAGWATVISTKPEVAAQLSYYGKSRHISDFRDT